MSNDLPSKCARTRLLAAVLAVAVTLPAAAQETRPAAQETPPAPDPGELVYVQPLPTQPIAWVDGEPIPASRLLEVTLQQNFSQIAQNLAFHKVLEIELKLQEIEITDEEIEEELAMLLEQMAPGRSVEEIRNESVGSTSFQHLKSQAWASRGWKKIYWKMYNIPQEQQSPELNKFIVMIVMRNVQQNYEVRVRGKDPAPTIPGVVAQVRHRPTGTEIIVGANEALDFVMGLVKQGSLLDIRDSLVESFILDKEMEKHGVEVTSKEVMEYARSKREEFAGNIITWDQILMHTKGLSVDQELERWRRVQAWKRITGYEEDPATIDAFREEHKPLFMGATKKVSHILVRTTDDVTGLSLGEGKEKEAKRRAELLYKKAMEGVPFGMLAKRFSDDKVTARGEGRLAQPVKPVGGPLDPAFREAAWELEDVGDISEPVRSRYGYHVIKLDEYSKGGPKEPDWSQPRYANWVREEYETARMEEYLQGLKEEAEIKLAPASEIFSLKGRSYWDPEKLERDGGKK